MVAFFWKICYNYCGCCEEEAEKHGLLVVPSGSTEWYCNDELAAEARKHHETSLKIYERESSILEEFQKRQERRHRLTVFAKQVVATECPKTYPKTKEELEFLDKVLVEDRNFIFCDFSDKERRFMVDVLRRDTTVQKGDVLFTVGDIGENFYIIDQGQIDIISGHDTGVIEIKTLGRGDSFGEAALLFDVPRITSARARTDCVLWTMNQHCFRAKLAHHALNQEEEMIGLLRRVSLFVGMADPELRKFANSMERIHFQPDERIVNKGDVGSIFYIIEDGIVRVHGMGGGDSKSKELELSPGEFFGERSLLTGEPRSAHATAKTAVTAWAVDRDTFENLFGPLQDVIQHNMKKRFLKAIPSFADSDLNPHEYDLLAERMHQYCYKEGHRIDEVGKPYRQELIIVEHGRVVVYDGDGDIGKAFTLKNGSYYGDKHIRDNPAKKSRYNVICEENTTVWAISRQDLQEVIGDFDRLGQSISFSLSRRVSAYSRSIQMRDLERRRVLGHGGFGKVWLVQHKTTREYYALKELNKRRVIDKKQTNNVLREKEILSTLKHPFILSEVSSFQDEANLYILMDLIQGGELYSVIVDTQGKGLPVHDAKFYAACVFAALSYFHARLIVYRDLKPENIMIDRDGYCVIVDLGFAKVVTSKTYTLCGTPEYLAPEVFMSQGHDKAADLWSFAVLVYELLTGRSPFYKPGLMQVDMFKKIVRVEYEIPESVDAVSTDFIQKLLVRNPAKRLGNLSNGSQDVCDHPWFESVEWRKLQKKELKAPWTPTIKEGEGVDESHSDVSYDAYRETSFGKPLNKEEQIIFKRF